MENPTLKDCTDDGGITTGLILGVVAGIIALFVGGLCKRPSKSLSSFEVSGLSLKAFEQVSKCQGVGGFGCVVTYLKLQCRGLRFFKYLRKLHSHLENLGTTETTLDQDPSC